MCLRQCLGQALGIGLLGLRGQTDASVLEAQELYFKHVYDLFQLAIQLAVAKIVYTLRFC